MTSASPRADSSPAGGDLGWTHTEASFALIGVDEAYAKALGRDFGQDAIFEWTSTELSVLACDGERRSSAGWRMAAAQSLGASGLSPRDGPWRYDV